MIQIPIKVECHSGYKADEYPEFFYWNDVRFEIKKITDRWYQLGRSSEWPAADYFKICTKTDLYFIMKHEKNTSKWFLIAPDDPSNLITFPYDRLN